MGQKKVQGKLLETAEGKRLHDPNNMIGRFIINNSKAPIILAPEESQDGYLISQGKYPMKEKILKPWEYTWVDHMYFVASTTDGSTHGSFIMCSNMQEVSDHIGRAKGLV